MVAIGIDGCKDGWIAVTLQDGTVADVRHLPAIDALADLVADHPPSAIGIDIPLAFPVGGESRPAELAARAALGPRRSSVFLTPPIEVLSCTTHAEATALSVERTGRGISRQSYGLRAKIFEVQAWIADAPVPVHEVHPELSFTQLLGHPAAYSKKSWGGIVERRTALHGVGIGVGDVPAEVARVAPDDVLDAAAAAWTAHRIATGAATRFPSTGTDTPIWA